jgi:Protein of unknown function (DUF2867)
LALLYHLAMKNALTNLTTPVAIPIPLDARVNGFYAITQLADAYAINLPADAVMEPEVLARFMFESQPNWAKQLMQLRDVLVSVFGLKTAKQLTAPKAGSLEKRIAIFKIYESTANEVFLGEDDSHLNFRISAQVRPATDSSAAQFIISSVVHCNNLLGRTYATLIAPFHRSIVKAAMKRAATIGWPKVAIA